MRSGPVSIFFALLLLAAAAGFDGMTRSAGAATQLSDGRGGGVIGTVSTAAASAEVG